MPDNNEERVDLRLLTDKEIAHGQKLSQLLFKFNHTMPGTEEYTALLQKLFSDMGEGSYVAAPVSGSCPDKIKIGKNVYINSNLLAMARGGIDIEDDVRLAANVQLITNNHDFYEREILTCRPIHIRKGAWIGAGATVLPGVTIGKYAIVGAAAVVTKDVPDYAVAVGNPAKIVKMLDKERFS